MDGENLYLSIAIIVNFGIWFLYSFLVCMSVQFQEEPQCGKSGFNHRHEVKLKSKLTLKSKLKLWYLFFVILALPLALRPALPSVLPLALPGRSGPREWVHFHCRPHECAKISDERQLWRAPFFFLFFPGSPGRMRLQHDVFLLYRLLRSPWGSLRVARSSSPLRHLGKCILLCLSSLPWTSSSGLQSIQCYTTDSHSLCGTENGKQILKEIDWLESQFK